MKRLCLFFILLLTSHVLTAAHQANLHYMISGVEDPIKKNITQRLDKAIYYLNNQHAIPTLDKFIIEAKEHIIKALYPYGYFNPIIHTKILGQQQVNFHVIPGIPVKVKRITITIDGDGKQEHAFKRLLQRLPIQINEILNTEQYLKLKHQLILIAEKKGYLDANFKQSMVSINPNTHTAIIILHLTTGPQYYFGQLTFASGPYSPTFLAKFADIKAGMPYSTNKLTALQNNLSNNGYCTEVIINSQHKATTAKKIPVTVSCLPKAEHNYSIGVGYGTDTGARITSGWDWHRVNAWGHQLQTTLQLSTKQKDLETRYIIPGANPVTDSYLLSSSLFSLTTPSGDSRAIKLKGSAIFTHQEWKTSYNMNALYERNTDRLLGKNKFTSTLLYPSINWQFIQADNTIYPSNGLRINLNLAGANKALLADVNFLQGEIDIKYIQRFNVRHRFIVHAALGYTLTPNVEQLPTSLQFLIGGSQSIRAYEYQSIGSGKALSEFGFEYQFRLAEKWYASLFFDAGNVSDRFSTNLKRGIGIGIGYLTPVGPVQLAIAKPLDNYPLYLQKKNQAYRIVINIGPDL